MTIRGINIGTDDFNMVWTPVIPVTYPDSLRVRLRAHSWGADVLSGLHSAVKNHAFSIPVPAPTVLACSFS